MWFALCEQLLWAYSLPIALTFNYPSQKKAMVSTLRSFKLWISCGLVWFDHGFVNCLASDLLLCPFHNELIIWEKMSFFFCFFFFGFVLFCLFVCFCFFAKQIIRDLQVVSSCIVIDEFTLSIHLHLKLSWRNLEVSECSFLRKSTKRKSLIDAFGIFHDNIYLSELRRVWYQATEYTILSRNYTHAFSLGVESDDHSYCCDFDKSLLKLFSASNPLRFSIDENYPREIQIWSCALLIVLLVSCFQSLDYFFPMLKYFLPFQRQVFLWNRRLRLIWQNGGIWSYISHQH